MSIYSMKSNRQISKEQTFEKILNATKQVIIKKGVLSFTTLEIANTAKIAHGTLFAHFSNKELLVTEIFKRELLRIAKNLKDITYSSDVNLSGFLTAFIDYLSDEEDFITVIAREFPFYNATVQREIIANEAIVKIMLHQMVEAGVENGIYRNTDITTLISVLFATIYYYLARKEFHVKGNGSLLQQKKQNIIETFLLMIKK